MRTLAPGHGQIAVTASSRAAQLQHRITSARADEIVAAASRGDAIASQSLGLLGGSTVDEEDLQQNDAHWVADEGCGSVAKSRILGYPKRPAAYLLRNASAVGRPRCRAGQSIPIASHGFVGERRARSRCLRRACPWSVAEKGAAGVGPWSARPHKAIPPAGRLHREQNRALVLTNAETA